MKKTILLVVGCGDKFIETDHYTSEGLRVSIIDSCEYIHYSCGWGLESTVASARNAGKRNWKSWLNN